MVWRQNTKSKCGKMFPFLLQTYGKDTVIPHNSLDSQQLFYNIYPVSSALDQGSFRSCSLVLGSSRILGLGSHFYGCGSRISPMR